MPSKSYQALVELPLEELNKQLNQLEREWQLLRFSLANQEVQDTSQFKKLRHKRSQIMTVLQLRQQVVN